MKNADKNTKNSNKNILNIAEVVDKASKYDEIQDYTLSNGKNIQFYPYFSRTKVKEIIEEFQSYTQSDDKDDQAFMELINKNDFSTILFWYFLCVKKFTHFGEQMKECKQVKDLAPYYNALLETGVLEEIINDVFIYDELKKINDMFANDSAIMVSAMEFLNTYEDSLEDARSKFKQQFNK